jgi:hypothetical protein
LNPRERLSLRPSGALFDDSFEQLCPDLLFKMLNLHAQSGLDDMQILCGAAEIKVLRQLEKRSDLPDFHLELIPPNDHSDQLLLLKE